MKTENIITLIVLVPVCVAILCSPPCLRGSRTTRRRWTTLLRLAVYPRRKHALCGNLPCRQLPL